MFWLIYVALDIGYIKQHEFDELMNMAQEVSRIIGGLGAAVEKQMNNRRKN